MDAGTAGFEEYLDQVSKRRAELRASLSALELALAAPASGRAPAWAERVHAALVELSADFAEHVRITEGDEGLYSKVLCAEPRMVGAVRRLTAEHVGLSRAIGELLARFDAGRDDPGQVPGARRQGTELLGALVRHRQAGSDLVYEAYAVDIGGGD